MRTRSFHARSPRTLGLLELSDSSVPLCFQIDRIASSSLHEHAVDDRRCLGSKANDFGTELLAIPGSMSCLVKAMQAVRRAERRITMKVHCRHEHFDVKCLAVINHRPSMRAIHFDIGFIQRRQGP